MRTHDAADDPAASFWPEIEDTIEDCIFQATSQFTGVFPTTKSELNQLVSSILANAIAEAVGTGVGIKDIVDQYCIEHGTNRGDTLREIIAEIVNSERPVYFADVIAYSIGLKARQGISGAQIAKKHGVGRQAFSKQCLEFIRKFKLPVSAGMKSKLAEEVYSLTNRKNHKISCK